MQRFIFSNTNFGIPCVDVFYQVTTLFLRGLIFRITNITHVDSGYGGKKDIKAELLKLNKSVNIVCHYFHANYKETETFHLNIKTTVINQFD